MISDHAELSRFERLLSLVTRVRPGEGRAAFLFFLHGFLLLSSYQVVKALREAFMLTKFSAETRSYAVAITALVLMFVVPFYGWVRRHLDGARLLRAVTIFFVTFMDDSPCRTCLNRGPPPAVQHRKRECRLTEMRAALRSTTPGWTWSWRRGASST